MCKLYEGWNLEANFICACKACGHPRLTDEQVREHETHTYGRVRWEEKDDDGLDPTPTEDVASWFVADDESEDDDGHDEAREEIQDMSETETMAPPVVHTEAPENDPIADEATESVTPVADATEDDGPKRGRGELEGEVKEVTDLFVGGGLVLPDDKKLTPHYIAQAIEAKFGYDEAPSTGAVAAVLNRWAEYGYAEFGTSPFHFVGLTSAGETDGLDALRLSVKEARKEARRAAREAAKAAKAAETDSNDE